MSEIYGSHEELRIVVFEKRCPKCSAESLDIFFYLHVPEDEYFIACDAGKWSKSFTYKQISNECLANWLYVNFQQSRQ